MNLGVLRSRIPQLDSKKSVAETELREDKIVERRVQKENCGKAILVWNLAFKDKFGDPAKCRKLKILEVLVGLVLVRIPATCFVSE